MGEKATLKEQELLTANVPLQVLAASEKSLGLLPPMVTEVKLTGSLPMLETVALCAMLVVPVF